MKKQINPSIKAHLLWSALILLALLAVCAIPFALAQRNAARRSLPPSQLPTTSNVGAAPPATNVRAIPPAIPAGDILYDQMDNPAPTPGGVTSQDFEASLDTFDSFAADDFVVPGGETWNITGVDASPIMCIC